MKSALVLLECLQSQFHDPVLTSLCSWWELEGACGVEAGGEFTSESWGGGQLVTSNVLIALLLLPLPVYYVKINIGKKLVSNPPPPPPPSLPPGVFEGHT